MRVRRVGPAQPEYPLLLTEIPGRPSLLHVIGRPMEPAPYCAVVGTRRASRYGLRLAEGIARDLSAAGVAIVSGMAWGIDAAAHAGALKAGGTTIAVLGSGPDVCYPSGNRNLYNSIAELGTVISEYELGTRPLPHHFPERNRIIAGMSLGVVVVEGRANGGAMITARLAGEFGREVFAVPGPVHSENSEGPHLLIKEGCRLAETAADVLEGLGMEAPPADTLVIPSLEPDEQRVVAALSATPTLLDSVAVEAGMPASTAASVLARLEIKGVVTRHAGARFSVHGRVNGL